MLLSIASEVIGSKAVNTFKTPYGQVKKESNKEIEVYFICDREYPVRACKLEERNNYITCHIDYNGFKIICEPRSEGCLYKAIKRKSDDQVSIFKGYVINAPYPLNEKSFEVQFTIKYVPSKMQIERKIENPKIYIHSVTCKLPKEIVNISIHTKNEGNIEHINKDVEQSEETKKINNSSTDQLEENDDTN